MLRRTHVVLLATLLASSAWGQEVSVYGTTLAQLWKEDTPGFDKNTYAPMTQYLGIDATQLGTDALSLHFFGWGRLDLADSTAFYPSLGAKSGGDLTYGYMRYRFPQANAEVKLGRFVINQGVGAEQVDGVSARTDLRGGFTLSVFGGKPVLYKTLDEQAQKDYEYQRDVIFGTRLGYRLLKIGEVGVSFLQDGTSPGRSLVLEAPVDYTRKQVAGDIRISPNSIFSISGRTIWDIANHPDMPANTGSASRIAEHDYNVIVKVASMVAVTGNFAERNFQAYFAGTNLPSLFRQDEKGKFRSHGLSVIYGSAAAWEVVADYRQTHRDSFGTANRYGGEIRWNDDALKLKSGLGYHRVTADDVTAVGLVVPSYSLAHHELRAWVMYEGTLLTGSLDGILHDYDDKNNPNLNGKTTAYEMVASLGYKASENLKMSGDISYGANPLFQKELRGLLRAEWRFGLSRKGGGK